MVVMVLWFGRGRCFVLVTKLFLTRAGWLLRNDKLITFLSVLVS